jgi:Flp pilus assembly pilin Flp
MHRTVRTHPPQTLAGTTPPPVERRISVRSARTGRKEVNHLLKLFDYLERLNREDGQTMAEYGVVLAVITIAVFGALALLSGNIVNAISRVAGYIS